MRLYEGTVEEFRNNVIDNAIAEKLSAMFEKYYNKRVNRSEFNAWNISLRFLKDVLDASHILKNKIVIEYEVPYSEKRIDVILFGKDKDRNDSIVIIELKQWSNENVEDCDNEGNVVVDFGRFKKEHPHPSLQVEGYYYHLKDMMSVFEEKPAIYLEACVYCHNYKRGDHEVLYLPKFQELVTRYPLFSKEEAIKLGTYLKEKLSMGDGLDVFGRFTHSILRPSKKLLDHTSDMINKQQIFNLIDEQITAYNAIMSKAKKLARTNEKAVIIVKGGPGTGKSVIALEVMGELLRQGKNVYHATGSSAFTNTLRNILGMRARERFRFFYHFTDKGENEVDVLICDEAHRIRRDSSDFRVPVRYKSIRPQIDDLIRPARLSVFFIDEQQIVRPNELGSIELIKSSARRLRIPESSIYEYELKTQFRCGGSGEYVDWIEKALKIKEAEDEITIQTGQKIEFQIVNSPAELKRVIDEKNREKKNCARIVAGFCWPWSNPRIDGSLVNDVRIGDFEMPWEKKNEFWKWATDDSGMEQVGTVYTSQGFEFDYIGVIFGNDLVYDKETRTWLAKPENSYDVMVTRNNEKLIEHLKGVYRVLLTRAHKGVYVYFMDKYTERLFRSMME